MTWSERSEKSNLKLKIWLSYLFSTGPFRLNSFEWPILAITNSCIGLSSTRFLSLSQKAEQLQRRGEVLEGIQALNPRARCVLQAKIMLMRSKKKDWTSAFSWDVLCCSQNIPYWQPTTGAAEHGECVWPPFLELHEKMQTNRPVRNRKTWSKGEEAKKLTIHERMFVSFGNGYSGWQQNQKDTGFRQIIAHNASGPVRVFFSVDFFSLLSATISRFTPACSFAWF
jgi:hypothetical protein